MDTEEDDGGLEAPQVAALALAQYGFDTLIETAGFLNGSPRARTRIALAYALGKAGDPRALPLLEELSHDPDDQVVLWTSLALAELGRCAVPVMIQRLREVSSTSLPRAVFFADGIAKVDRREASSFLDIAIAQVPAPVGEQVARIVAEIAEVAEGGGD